MNFLPGQLAQQRQDQAPGEREDGGHGEEQEVLSEKPSSTSPKCSPMKSKSKYWLKNSLIARLLAPVPGNVDEGAPSPAPLSSTASAGAAQLASMRRRTISRRFVVEPLFVDLRVGPVVDHFFEAFVDFFEQFGVVLGDAIPYFSSVGTFSAISTPPASSTAFCGDRRVDDHGFDRAGFEGVDRVGAFGVGAEFAGVGFFLRRVRGRSCPAGRRRSCLRGLRGRSMSLPSLTRIACSER